VFLALKKEQHVRDKTQQVLKAVLKPNFERTKHIYLTRNKINKEETARTHLRFSSVVLS